MAALKILIPQIHKEWWRWKLQVEKPGYLSFSIHLKNNRPDLLKFRCSGAPERKIKEIILMVDKSIL